MFLGNEARWRHERAEMALSTPIVRKEKQFIRMREKEREREGRRERNKVNDIWVCVPS